MTRPLNTDVIAKDAPATGLPEIVVPIAVRLSPSFRQVGRAAAV